MSRIGKKPIEIPAGVEIQIEGQTINAKGPSGTLSYVVSDDFQIVKEGNAISLVPQASTMSKDTIPARWGTERQMIANMVQGVKENYVRVLEIEGVGYRAGVEDGKLMLHVGFTNPVSLPIPEGLQVAVEKNTIKVTGADKAKVSQFAAGIRRVRPVEPYKGKGIKYLGETVRRKLGKKAAATGAAPGGAK